MTGSFDSDSWFEPLENVEGLTEFSDMLSVNYAAVGFTLDKNSVRVVEKHFGTYVQFIFTCACGTKEYGSVSIQRRDQLLSKKFRRDLVRGVLNATASPDHIKQDVANGILPPSALDLNAFTGRLVDE